MKKLILIVLLTISTAAYSFQCGIKPIVPIHCDDLICINGQWQCINYNKKVGM